MQTLSRMVFAAFGISALAHGGCALQPSGPQPERSPAVIATDRDADGRITEAEWQRRVDNEFEFLDTNQDGQFTRDEPPTTIFINDLDGDDVLEASETPTLVALADTNEDGDVTVDELDAVFEQAQAFDENGDGAIGREEYRRARSVQFDSLDLNDDGVISPEEFRAVLFRF